MGGRLDERGNGPMDEVPGATSDKNPISVRLDEVQAKLDDLSLKLEEGHARLDEQRRRAYALDEQRRRAYALDEQHRRRAYALGEQQRRADALDEQQRHFALDKRSYGGGWGYRPHWGHGGLDERSYGGLDERLYGVHALDDRFGGGEAPSLDGYHRRSWYR